MSMWYPQPYDYDYGYGYDYDSDCLSIMLHCYTITSNFKQKRTCQFSHPISNAVDVIDATTTDSVQQRNGTAIDSKVKDAKRTR